MTETIRELCIDAGSENCPCLLAASGDCITCSRLQGKDCCDSVSYTHLIVSMASAAEWTASEIRAPECPRIPAKNLKKHKNRFPHILTRETRIVVCSRDKVFVDVIKLRPSFFCKNDIVKNR